jgi:hypothetical protein
MAETTLSEQVIRQAPYLEEFQKKILEASFARGETPVSIPDIQVAGLDPLTQQASTIGQGIGHQQNVTLDALAEMQRQASIQQNQLSAQAVGAGAFGGSRQGIAQQELNRNLTDMQSRRIFEDLSRNYSQAQNAAQTTFENQQNRQQVTIRPKNPGGKSGTLPTQGIQRRQQKG